VLTGSTNFSLRGLYIQANNVLLFEEDDIADLYARVFEAYWTEPKKFRANPLSQEWHVMRNEANSRFSFCFSPHADEGLSLDPIAKAIASARSSVLYSVVFLSQLTGAVKTALDDLVNRTLFSYGVVQRTGKLAVQKPDGSTGVVPFAYLGSKAPFPFDREWSGGGGNMVHHKFVVTDFNGPSPKVFTGSSNLAGGGEKANGDNLILIEDRTVAISYAIEALRMFDHFHFRASTREGDRARRVLKLQGPPMEPGARAWWAPSYVSGHVKERDRKLFAG
jgi:phosphatidylserine/phosphatidylglycerophosphate/cardiolipin synthase-like enzyme